MDIIGYMHTEMIMVAMKTLVMLLLFSSTNEKMGNSTNIIDEWWNKYANTMRM